MGHEGSKASKAVFVSDDRLFTTGFGRTCNRQYGLFDIVNQFFHKFEKFYFFFLIEI